MEGPIRTGNRLEDLWRQIRSRRGGEPFRPSMGEPVLRVVLGLPGDQVHWGGAADVVKSSRDGQTYRYTLPVLHHLLDQDEETILLEDGWFFLVALQPGRADSRATGAVPAAAIHFRVQSIIWPRERRGLLDPFPPDDGP